MQSVMNQFSMVERLSTPRSQFDRSHGHKFTMDAGWLVPYYWDEVLPGDTFSMNTHAFVRMASPLFPIMDNAFIDTHFFFTPTRIIWDNARKFFGEQANPTDSIDYQIPVLAGTIASSANNTATSVQQFLNVMGIPHGIAPSDVDINALPFRAYNLIYNEWFRDQNLINSLPLNTGDGPDTLDPYFLTGMQRRGKRADYFTSCLPWPQKGEAISLPLGTRAPVKGIGLVGSGTTASEIIRNLDATYTEPHAYTTAPADANYNILAVAGQDINASSSEIFTDLTTATAATINDLREAFQVQKLLERDARSGTRYPELLKNHFGVTFYDTSYRPEYLGGGSTPLNISPIAQQAQNATSGTTDGTGVGDLAAMGTASISGHGFTKSFNEHGYVMAIMSVRADLTYQKGLRRELSKKTRYDLYWPSLAHLGEQAVLSKEIFCDGTAGDEDVFGYQERYAEYRYKPSQISGLFQSDATASLDAWHLSQDFLTRPVLGKTFIEEDPPFDRVIQVPSEPHFIVDTYNKLKCARPMPTYATPGMIDHF